MSEVLLQPPVELTTDTELAKAPTVARDRSGGICESVVEPWKTDWGT